MVSDIENLVANFDDSQLEMLTICALKLAKLKADKFTGVTCIEINTNQGGLNDPRVVQSEVVRIGKKPKRRVRSKLQ